MREVKYLVTLQQMRTEEFQRIFEAMDTHDIEGAETAMDSLVSLIQEIPAAAHEFKELDDKIKGVTNKDYAQIEKNIQRWNYDDADAPAYRGMMRNKRRLANLVMKRAFLVKLGNEHKIFASEI